MITSAGWSAFRRRVQARSGSLRRADRRDLVTPQSRIFAEMLIRTKDRTIRAVLDGMLREADRW